jgi:hypothetical protein
MAMKITAEMISGIEDQSSMNSSAVLGKTYIVLVWASLINPTRQHMYGPSRFSTCKCTASGLVYSGRVLASTSVGLEMRRRCRAAQGGS